MPKESNIVHRYFKKKSDKLTILIKINPMRLSGLELILVPDGTPQMRELIFDAHIWDELKADGFEESSALEFNLYHSGLA